MEWGLLEVLSAEDRGRLLAQARRRHFEKHETIFHEGDLGETLHLVSQGHVAIRLTTVSGERCILRVIGPGGWFGELAVVAPAERNATVVALDRVVSLVLPREEVDSLRRRVPAFERVLSEALVAELRRLSAALMEAFFVPVDKRVLRRLGELAELYGPGATTVILPLTQDEIAQAAGTTRPTANKVLQSAATVGMVSLRRGQVQVIDRSLLARAAR
jgi:CRP/FNR family transcriptional regulator, cyclic AMP receptor protein